MSTLGRGLKVAQFLMQILIPRRKVIEPTSKQFVFNVLLRATSL